MNQQGTVTNQEVSLVGDQVLVTSTVEERLTRQDILNRIDLVKRQKEQLVFQSKEIKKSHQLLVEQETTLTEMLTMFPTEDPEIL